MSVSLVWILKKSLDPAMQFVQHPLASFAFDHVVQIPVDRPEDPVLSGAKCFAAQSPRHPATGAEVLTKDQVQ